MSASRGTATPVRAILVRDSRQARIPRSRLHSRELIQWVAIRIAKPVKIVPADGQEVDNVISSTLNIQSLDRSTEMV